MYYLINEFEYTRIKDQRNEELEEKKWEIPKEEYIFDFVDKSLLEL